MDKRGPRQVVKKCERIGDHGEVFWYIELACGHTVQRNRKYNVGTDKLSCKKCLPSSGLAIQTAYSQDDFNHFDEIKAIAKIAAHFNVRMDQIQIGRGMATIYLDSEEIKRIVNP